MSSTKRIDFLIIYFFWNRWVGGGSKGTKESTQVLHQTNRGFIVKYFFFEEPDLLFYRLCTGVAIMTIRKINHRRFYENMQKFVVDRSRRWTYFIFHGCNRFFFSFFLFYRFLSHKPYINPSSRFIHYIRFKAMIMHNTPSCRHLSALLDE